MTGLPLGALGRESASITYNVIDFALLVVPAVEEMRVVCVKHSKRYANLAMRTHTTLTTQHSLHNTPGAQYARPYTLTTSLPRLSMIGCRPRVP